MKISVEILKDKIKAEVIDTEGSEIINQEELEREIEIRLQGISKSLDDVISVQFSNGWN